MTWASLLQAQVPGPGQRAQAPKPDPESKCDPANLKKAASSEQLAITVCQGDGAKHAIDEKQGVPIDIAVTDDFGRPQAGADVGFWRPEKEKDKKNQPNIVLPNDAPSATLKSDANGRAQLTDVRGNRIKGLVPIRVTATFEGRSGEASLTHENVTPFWTKKKSGIFASAAGVAAIILYEVFKPGPPTATINTPTSTASSPQGIKP